MIRPRARPRPLIAVGAAAPVYRGRGLWFDGENPVRHAVDLSFDDAASALVIAATAPRAEAVRWPYADLRRLPGLANPAGAVLAAVRRPDARLVVADEDLALIRTRALSVDRAPPPPPRAPSPASSTGPLALVALVAAAVAILVLAALGPALGDLLGDLAPAAATAAPPA